jgi:cyclophilin family peptidyl-prolyl cis-trans isomerase
MKPVAFGLLCAALLAWQPAPSLTNPGDPAFRATAPPAFHVRFDTTKGPLVLEVRREWAPHGVDRFFNLVRAGYYDDSAIFRVRPGVFAQFGINGDPRIARAWRTATIPDDPRVLSNVRGTLSYAFAVPHGRTTQVFINLRDNSADDDTEPFVPFARVTSGMEAADAFYAGYGERAGGGIRAGKQDPVFAGGNPFFRANFPRLDYLRRAVIEE